MKRILIVEDNEFNLDLLVQLLEDDYILCHAEDGLCGIEMAEAERPDLILMDVAMPKLGGYESMQQIKSNSTLRHIPILALSSHAMIGDAEKALAAGFDDYLTKPLDEDLLFARLKYYLGTSHE